MARNILRQVNGKYAIWSTIADGYIVKGATPEEIIAKYTEESKEEITESIMRQIAKADMTPAIRASQTTFTEL